MSESNGSATATEEQPEAAIARILQPVHASKRIDFVIRSEAEFEIIGDTTPENLEAVHDLLDQYPTGLVIHVWRTHYTAGEGARFEFEPPEPEPSEYQPFPVDALPGDVERFIVELSDSIGCDAAYVALPLLTALGACIGNTFRVVVKRGWYEPPILWTAVVSESGTAKSPAMRPTVADIKAIQAGYLKEHAEAVKEYKTAMLVHQQALKDWKAEPKGEPPEEPTQPQPKRLLVQDSTIEALAPILQHNAKGLLMQRDELSGWFASFNRYSGKAGGDEAAWLSLFNGESITVDRKGDGTAPIYIHSGLVSVTGGIQPGILSEQLTKQHRESGLAARILMAQPPRNAPEWTDAELKEQTASKMTELFERLSKLPMRFDGDQWESNYIGMSGDAKAVFVPYYNQHQERQNELYGDEAAAWSKLKGYVPRFALLVQMMTDPGSGRVERPAMESAIRIVDWFKLEADRIYGYLAGDDATKEQQKLAEWIRNRGGEVTARDLYTSGPRKYRNKPEDAEAELKELVRGGFGFFDIGRRSSVFILS